MQTMTTAQGPPAELDTAVCTIRPRKCSRRSGRRANSCWRHAPIFVAVLHASNRCWLHPMRFESHSPSEDTRKH